MSLVLDLHAHSSKLNNFFYGNSDKFSRDDTKQFVKIAANQNGLVKLQACKFAT